MKRIAVYGTLKRGHFNHNRFGEMKFIGTDYIDDLQIWIYDHLGIPFAVPGAGGITTVEVYDIDDDMFENINSMELGAGYKPEIINTCFGKATIWIYPSPPEGTHKMKGISY